MGNEVHEGKKVAFGIFAENKVGREASSSWRPDTNTDTTRYTWISVQNAVQRMYIYR